ncbi:MAG: metallophosphoesterase family protein [Candidatus Lernaella stagnicola]|nr:metallophosphoesterase family protein [Candidatus Lernaella stagnicola]
MREAGRTVRIGILSDTHLDGPWNPEPFRRLLSGPFAGVERVLHAGDVGDYDWLTAVALAGVPVTAVAGNCDEQDDPRLPARRILDIHGYRIGLIHGWGDAARTPHRVARAFAQDDVNAVVFGHTHQPHLATGGQVTYFNPGSMFWPRNSRESVGLLTLSAGRPKWTHITLEGSR